MYASGTRVYLPRVRGIRMSDTKAVSGAVQLAFINDLINSTGQLPLLLSIRDLILRYGKEVEDENKNDE